MLRCLISAIVVLAAASTLAGESARPNFLVILADDLGWSDLGCYGGEIETPNLDALAKNGLQFTQCYNTARCWPSRAAIMTGYYAQQVRRDTIPNAPSGGRGVRPDWAPLLPAMLRPVGYRTYHSGKWHIDGKPLENGFDRSYEITGGQSNFFDPRGAIEHGPPLLDAENGNYYSTIATAEHAIRCLQEHAANHAERPFFHYLCFIAPHFPLHALPEDIARYRDRYRRGWNEIQRERYERMTKKGLTQHPLPEMEREVGPPYHFPDALRILGPGEVNRPLPWNELTDEQREFQAAKMAIHAAMVDRMDRELGRVLEQLKKMDAFEDTLILFASDNGASAEIMVRGRGHDPQAAPGSELSYLCLGPGWSSACNTPYRRHKTWVHEGGNCTPFIAHWPAGIAARGELRHTPAHLIDVVPTVLELAGIKRPENKDRSGPEPPGHSLAPLFQRDGAVQHEVLWWLHEGNRAVRMGDWKLVAAKGDPWELYDLSRDRGETANLAEKHPDKVRELEARWQKMTEQFYKDATSP